MKKILLIPAITLPIFYIGAVLMTAEVNPSKMNDGTRDWVFGL